MTKFVHPCGAHATKLGFILAGCIGMAGCAHSSPTTEPATVHAPIAPARPVIVRLESRFYSVVISAGPKSPLYTVHNASGELMAQNLTLDELRSSRRDLYDQLAPALSPKGSASASVLWADSRGEP
jgi:hypothetical protein